MKQDISNVASTCFYQLRRLHQLRCLLGQEVTAQLVSAFIMSCIDYCNSVLAGLPHTTLEPLQRVQNAAARLILSFNLRDDVKPGLKQLHWLPIEYRIQFNLSTYAPCTLCYSSAILNRRCSVCHLSQ